MEIMNTVIINKYKSELNDSSILFEIQKINDRQQYYPFLLFPKSFNNNLSDEKYLNSVLSISSLKNENISWSSLSRFLIKPIYPNPIKPVEPQKPVIKIEEGYWTNNYQERLKIIDKIKNSSISYVIITVLFWLMFVSSGNSDSEISIGNMIAILLPSGFGAYFIVKGLNFVWNKAIDIFYPFEKKFISYPDQYKNNQSKNQSKEYKDKLDKYERDLKTYEDAMQNLSHNRDLYYKNLSDWKTAFNKYVNKAISENNHNISSIQYQGINNPAREGSSENLLFLALEKIYPQYLKIDTKLDYYYPDLVLWVNGIGIDIEIDEPYTFDGGIVKEIHYVLDYGGGESIDKSRDDTFVGKNWFVLRFAESQIKNKLQDCINIIQSVVNFITSNSGNERYLNDYNRLSTQIAVARWTKERARAMARTNQRFS
jgi:hypothetical protein